MSMITCPEGYVRCPYDPAHVILDSRIQFHLVKCKQVHKESRLVECPFNSTHKIPEIELNCHKLYLCEDRKKVQTFLCSTNDTAPLFPVQQYEASTSEDWDEVHVETYNPNEHCKNMPILLNLPGATPSDRKNFRAEERQRYRNLVANENKSSFSKATTRIPQTRPKTNLREHTKSDENKK